MTKLSIFTRGFIKENPVFVMLLGMCPTLATSTSAMNGMAMGVATTFVLTMSNLVISLIKDLIPGQVRIPAFVVIIAAFVTIVELTMQAFVPDLFATLGIYIPLIVVNCIILGRAEAFASKNKPVDSILDGLGMGIGFTLALIILGSIRELFGSGSIFDINIYSGDGALVFILPPGAFLVLGYLIAVINKLTKKKA